MIKKYHVNDSNEVKTCRAKHKPCQFGRYAHFYDKDDAQKLADLKMSALSKIPKLSKKPVTPLLRETVSKGRSSSYRRDERSDYEELWIRDSDGVPAIYTKINHRLWNMDKQGYVDGVLLCNLESNPKLRGNSHAIEALRVLKETNNVDTVYASGTFSKAGYKFYLRVKEVEKQTGERLLEIAPGEEISIDPYDEHNFVEDWDTEISMFPVR